ncbi:MAG: AraC family transcriptional regulator, partial [Rhodobacteraceae bacterium]|nr:AraC family transcriptional regulator [Paracoccaceae bacterium]
MLPSLPLPLISALVLAFVLAVLLLRHDRPGPFAALVGLCALQSAVIALAQHYGIAAFRSLQPITAAAIPPLAWAAFQFSVIRRPHLLRDVVHLAGPLLALAASLILPTLLDALIPALFLGYGGAILLAAWRGTDALPRLPFTAGDTPGLAWK